MKESARYAKIVEWSEEDQCYVGSAPGLIYGGCHDDDERQVFAELCEIVEKAIALHRIDSKPLPSATSGRDYVNRMQQVATAAVRHERQLGKTWNAPNAPVRYEPLRQLRLRFGSALRALPIRFLSPETRRRMGLTTQFC